jgi:phage-related minor tail protein
MESITAKGIMSKMGVALLAMAVALLAMAAFDGRNSIQYEIRGYQDLYNSLRVPP